MINAVVFDFDGLVLDTEGPVYSAWSEAFAAYGCGPLTIEEWSAEIGTAGALDLVGMMRARASVPFDEVEMHERRRARRNELLAHETCMPGVREWIDEADTLGLPVAIASSSPPDWVLGHLEQLGLRSRFAHVACAVDGVAAKPAPDTYIAACRAVAVAPGDALAVEDSPHGVSAAKAAGLSCVAVPHRITELLDMSHADMRLRSLAEMSLRRVVAALDG